MKLEAEKRIEEINNECKLLQTEIDITKDIISASKEALQDYVLRRVKLLKEKEKLSNSLV